MLQVSRTTSTSIFHLYYHDYLNAIPDRSMQQINKIVYNASTTLTIIYCDNVYIEMRKFLML